jgi:hypothetical protein
VRREAALDPGLELGRQRVGALEALGQAHEGVGLDQALLVLVPRTQISRTAGCPEQRVLDLERRDEDAADLEQVVVAPLVEVVAVRVAPEDVRRRAPLALERLARLGLVAPVAQRRRAAADAQRPGSPSARRAVGPTMRAS